MRPPAPARIQNGAARVRARRGAAGPTGARAITRALASTPLLAVLLLLAPLLLAPAPLGAQVPDSVVTVPRTSQPPRIEDFIQQRDDGRPVALPRPNVAGVRVDGFRQREPGDGEPASQATVAYLSYDDRNVYVVFVCSDDPALVRANVARREDIGDDDRVTIYLDTFHDRKRAYLFEVNPLGVQRDGIRTEGQSEDLSFDAVWSSDGRLTADGYVVRVAIPFRNLRFANLPVQEWGIALSRTIVRENEESFWPFITRRVRGFVPQFGTLTGMAGISPGRNVQVNPYAMLAQARLFDDDVPGHVSEGDQRIGLDAKMVLRDAFTLDATVNPDFSQVESDDPQVTVNERFEVFFPEKRPFFLENAGFFQVREDLFFSRRIVDPGMGLRLSGKAGPWAVGTLAMNDRAPVEYWQPAAGRDAWVGVVRVERELGESNAGIMVTDREFEDSPKHDRLFSADGRLRVGDNWELIGQFTRSDNRDHAGSWTAGWGGLAQVEFENRRFKYQSRYRGYTPDFAAPLGFVYRTGFRESKHEAEYTFRPDGFVTQFGPNFQVRHIWDYETGRLKDREIEGQLNVELKAETTVQLTHIQAYELYDDLGFRPHSTELQVETKWLSWLAVDVSYAWGAAVNHDPADDLLPALGRGTEAGVRLTVRPTPRLSWESRYNFSTLRTIPGSALLFKEHQLREKFNYQFSRTLFIRAIIDYQRANANTALFDDDPRQREWGTDVLFTYLLHPGTALHLGITDQYENLAVRRGLPGSDPEVVFTRSPRMSVGRQVFLKMSYLIPF
jgi:hypothetical protein